MNDGVKIIKVESKEELGRLLKSLAGGEHASEKEMKAIDEARKETERLQKAFDGITLLLKEMGYEGKEELLKVLAFGLRTTTDTRKSDSISIVEYAEAQSEMVSKTLFLLGMISDMNGTTDYNRTIELVGSLASALTIGGQKMVDKAAKMFEETDDDCDCDCCCKGAHEEQPKDEIAEHIAKVLKMVRR